MPHVLPSHDPQELVISCGNYSAVLWIEQYPDHADFCFSVEFAGESLRIEECLTFESCLYSALTFLGNALLVDRNLSGRNLS